MTKIKSFKTISWEIDEPAYRKDKAYSYSTISKFMKKGFNDIDKLFDKEESSSLTFGSIVDAMLTGTRKEFDSIYVVSEFPDISDTLRDIVKYIYDTYGKIYKKWSTVTDEIISEAADKFKYYMSKNYASYRIKNIKEAGESYYNMLRVCESKTLISNQDYNDALQCMNSLKTGITKSYFSNAESDDIEKLYQLKFKGTWEGMNLRCMADLIIVDHKNKRVIPCDLKTTSKKEWDFFKSFVEWGYWIQAQLYWYIIRQCMDNDEVFKDYSLEDYRFIVISRFTLTPLVWEYPDTQAIVDCTYGKERKLVLKNWRNIVPDLDYYLKEQPKLPIGIKGRNNLKQWLDNEY